MTWCLKAAPSERGMLLLNVIICHQAWRRLTPTSRAALVALADYPSCLMHKNTRRALRDHGLLDDNGITEAGRQVLKYRPDKEAAT